MIVNLMISRQFSHQLIEWTLVNLSALTEFLHQVVNFQNIFLNKTDLIKKKSRFHFLMC